MAFTNVTYTYKFNKWGAPTVIIDTHDGTFRPEMSEAEIQTALKNVIEKRARYKDDAEWWAVRRVFEGALEFLRTQILVDRM